MSAPRYVVRQDYHLRKMRRNVMPKLMEQNRRRPTPPKLLPVMKTMTRIDRDLPPGLRYESMPRTTILDLGAANG